MREDISVHYSVGIQKNEKKKKREEKRVKKGEDEEENEEGKYKNGGKAE